MVLATSLKQGVAVLPAVGFQLSASYLDLVQSKFGGNAVNVAYTVPQEATDTINQWAQDQTGDQDQDLMTNWDPNTQLLLATIGSFKGTSKVPS